MKAKNFLAVLTALIAITTVTHSTVSYGDDDTKKTIDAAKAAAESASQDLTDVVTSLIADKNSCPAGTAMSDWQSKLNTQIARYKEALKDSQENKQFNIKFLQEERKEADANQRVFSIRLNKLGEEILEKDPNVMSEQEKFLTGSIKLAQKHEGKDDYSAVMMDLARLRREVFGKFDKEFPEGDSRIKEFGKFDQAFLKMSREVARYQRLRALAAGGDHTVPFKEETAYLAAKVKGFETLSASLNTCAANYAKTETDSKTVPTTTTKTNTIEKSAGNGSVKKN